MQVLVLTADERKALLYHLDGSLKQLARETAPLVSIYGKLWAHNWDVLCSEAAIRGAAPPRAD